MKNKIILLSGLLFILALPLRSIAQEKARTSISSIKQKGSTVAITLTSSKPFRMGGNIYVLHVGSRNFEHSGQGSSKGKGTITFPVTMDEYNALQDGAGMYLTYGRIKEQGADMEMLSQLKSNKCWSLGKLNKSMLTK